MSLRRLQLLDHDREQQRPAVGMPEPVIGIDQQAEIEQALQAAEEAEDEDATNTLYEEGDRVGEALDALYAGLLDYAPETMATAGAVVTLDRDGEIVVHRGLVRPEDAKAARTQTDGDDGNTEGEGASEDGGENEDESADKPAKTLSDRLVRNLSAHRTAALKCELAKKPGAKAATKGDTTAAFKAAAKGIP